MKSRYRVLHLSQLAAGALILLAICGASAQEPKKAGSALVALVSDACPVVHAGDKVALDWNPAFDPEWPVEGIQSTRLILGRQEENGVNPLPRVRFTLGGRELPFAATPIANGFFHFEYTVPHPRRLPPGVYRVVDARVTARVNENYKGAAPRAQESPASGRFCFTVQSTQ
jgi:hypothetical protein